MARPATATFAEEMVCCMGYNSEAQAMARADIAEVEGYLTTGWWRVGLTLGQCLRMLEAWKAVLALMEAKAALRTDRST